MAARSRPLRVLFVNENLGGHATMHLAIAGALRDVASVDATFLDLPRPSALRRAFAVPIPGLDRHDADLQPLRNQLAQSWWVRRRLHSLAPGFDVVHAYTQNTVLLSRADLASHPTVVSTDATIAQHASMLPYRHPGRGTSFRVSASRRFEDRAYAAATLLVAQSQWTADSLRDTYAVPEDKLRVIPFGIPMTEPLPRSEPDPPEITFIGLSLRRKGGLRLLDLFRTRLSTRCVLNVVTPEPVPPTPGIRVYSDIVPGDPKLREVLARTAVLVFPSEIDTFGYAVIEAMAAGVAVVAVRHAALPEIVDHGVTGLLVDSLGTNEELAATIEYLIDRPALCRAMGDAGRVKALARYDARHTTDRLVEVLHEAVDHFKRIG